MKLATLFLTTALIPVSAAAAPDIKRFVDDMNAAGYTNVELDHTNGVIAVEAKFEGRKYEYTYDAETGELLSSGLADDSDDDDDDDDSIDDDDDYGEGYVDDEDEDDEDDDDDDDDDEDEDEDEDEDDDDDDDDDDDEDEDEDEDEDDDQNDTSGNAG